MLSRVPASFRALRSPASISSHRPSIFQKRWPCSITGWLGKRYTSSRLICRPSKRASSTRPLLAPRSTAAIVRVATHLPLSQRGYAAATPPSTLRMLPVLLTDRVGEAKNATASAISSGRILTPSVVRLRYTSSNWSGATPYVAARSCRHELSQIRDPASTASGLTVLTRILYWPPSSARQRARCASAALAVEYAAAFLPATSAFLLATKTRLPPRPCACKSRKPSRATRKYPVASTFQFLFHSARLVSVIGALEAS